MLNGLLVLMSLGLRVYNSNLQQISIFNLNLIYSHEKNKWDYKGFEIFITHS